MLILENYIIDSISSENYNIVTKTNREKISFLYNTFLVEKWMHQKHLFTNDITGQKKVFADWIAGLPISFNIDFNNDTILKVGYDTLFLNEQAKQEEEISFIINFFQLISSEVFLLIRKYDIKYKFNV